MGTQCTVKFKEHGKVILNVIHQYDGYPEGVGLDLAKWLKDKKIVKGYTLGQDKLGGYANGIGCLAAQYVTDFKKDIGGFYIAEPNETCYYDYIVEFDGKKFTIAFDGYKNTLEEFIQKFQE